MKFRIFISLMAVLAVVCADSCTTRCDCEPCIDTGSRLLIIDTAALQITGADLDSVLIEKLDASTMAVQQTFRLKMNPDGISRQYSIFMRDLSSSVQGFNQSVYHIRQKNGKFDITVSKLQAEVTKVTPAAKRPRIFGGDRCNCSCDIVLVRAIDVNAQTHTSLPVIIQ